MRFKYKRKLYLGKKSEKKKIQERGVVLCGI